MAARDTPRPSPLPCVWLLSDARNDAGLEGAIAALPPRSGFVFRHYHLPDVDRKTRFETLSNIARRHGHLVVLSRASGWGEDGSYGTRRLADSGVWLATAHDADQIDAAGAAGADGIFLSPVFATRSHADRPRLGVHGFHVLAQRTALPVIALGGMTAARAQELAWPRWGAIDGLAMG